MSKLLSHDHIFSIKMIIRVNNFIWKISFFLILFEFSNFYQESTNISDQIPETGEGQVSIITF